MSGAAFRAMTLEDALSDFPDLQRTPAIIVVVLNAAGGRVVRKQALRDAVETEIGARTTEAAISTACKRARAVIKNYGRIEASYGIGYRLIWDRPLPTNNQST
jgi:DNA-binding response OmpR family regulator